MRRGAGVWYLAIFVASVGLLSIIAWDALRGRSRDRFLTLSPSSTSAESNIQVRQSTVTPSTPPTVPKAASIIQAVQRVTPTPSVAIAVPTPAIVVPSPEVETIAPWPLGTATTTFTKLGRFTSATPRNDGKRSCLEVWDPETHMTKEEWKTACERAPRNP